MWAGECHKRFNYRESWKGWGMALMNVCEKEWNRFEKVSDLGMENLY